MDEQQFQTKPTPENAWELARTLELAAAAIPDSAQSYRERIVAVWSDQNRRYPAHPWIQQRLAQVQAALAHR